MDRGKIVYPLPPSGSGGIMTYNQYKPNISVFIRDTVSIKDNKIHEGDPGMLLHINGNSQSEN